jgi:hypothetical protein
MDSHVKDFKLHVKDFKLHVKDFKLRVKDFKLHVKDKIAFIHMIELQFFTLKL